jgi:TIR domain
VNKGENRADPDVRLGIMLRQYIGALKNEEFKLPGPCIFISHIREDTEACEPIAQYILSAGVKIYFDRYDKTLPELVREGNPDKITARIQEGIDLSTHMLCVVSPKTVNSAWVPFEVGYGCKAAIGLGILTLKGIPDDALPDYMKTARVVRGTRSLNQFIAELLGTTPERLIEQKAIKRYSETSHSLDGVLDWIK